LAIHGALLTETESIGRRSVHCSPAGDYEAMAEDRCFLKDSGT
jgi:hypothetical protein